MMRVCHTKPVAANADAASAHHAPPNSGAAGPPMFMVSLLGGGTWPNADAGAYACVCLSPKDAVRMRATTTSANSTPMLVSMTVMPTTCARARRGGELHAANPRVRLARRAARRPAWAQAQCGRTRLPPGHDGPAGVGKRLRAHARARLGECDLPRRHARASRAGQLLGARAPRRAGCGLRHHQQAPAAVARHHSQLPLRLRGDVKGRVAVERHQQPLDRQVGPERGGAVGEALAERGRDHNLGRRLLRQRRRQAVWRLRIPQRTQREQACQRKQARRRHAAQRSATRHRAARRAARSTRAPGIRDGQRADPPTTPRRSAQAVANWARAATAKTSVTAATGRGEGNAVE